MDDDFTKIVGRYPCPVEGMAYELGKILRNRRPLTGGYAAMKKASIDRRCSCCRPASASIWLSPNQRLRDAIATPGRGVSHRLLPFPGSSTPRPMERIRTVASMSAADRPATPGPTGAALGPHDLLVRWRATDNISPEEHELALAILSAEERDRAASFVFMRDRITFAAAHALLRWTLSKSDDVPPSAWMFTSNEYGKPSISGPGAARELTFSLAHADGLVACVVGHGVQLGIDVEPLDRVTDCLDLADRFFAPSETAALRACAENERQARFVELWTLKEAYVKATGVGLWHPLNTFAFDLIIPSSVRFHPPTDAERRFWQFALLMPTDRHRMAIAVRSGPDARRRIVVLPDDAGAMAATLRSSAPETGDLR